jgi:diaminopimelate decarboxylase
MTAKQVPFTKAQAASWARTYPLPFHIYDETAIRTNAQRLRAAFAWNPGFREFFAVKATPNPYLLKLLKAEGFGADCSSGPELALAAAAGIVGEAIMFTSNDTPAEEFRRACELGAVINLDDISHIDFLNTQVGLPELICLRYNPGPLKGGNAIIGHPEEAKYGFTREQLFEGYRRARDMGVKRFGIHTMVASNELDYRYFVETAELLFGLAVDLRRQLGIQVEFVNLGGGIGIPYRPEQTAVDLELLGERIRERYVALLVANGLDAVKVYLECGRMITGPYGYLVSRVLHLKHTYKTYVGLDACMANLMRPGMYGAYHHITVLGKEAVEPTLKCDVTGSLCENNDKFAIDRLLPAVEPGDLVVIHDAGAHGHAMGFNYNGKLRSAELLLRADGSVCQVRRAETEADLFATLDLDGLAAFRV